MDKAERMSESKKRRLLAEWMDVARTAENLFLGKFEERADEEGTVSQVDLVAAMTAMSGFAASFIDALSPERMPRRRVRDLLVSSIDEFLETDKKEQQPCL